MLITTHQTMRLYSQQLSYNHFYNYQADEAVNYGGIGGVIGHEISHGFDDSGSRYNADGNLVDWWTAEDLKQFSLTGALAAQYSALDHCQELCRW
jgi:predicted metalloendopeptidase